MKEIYQLNNLLNLTTEIDRPLNKTHRIKVSSIRRCGGVVISTCFFFIHSTLAMMRRRISLFVAHRRAAFTCSSGSHANSCN